jgi:TRAP-type mannitol/chloroaromatic compound transport system substrate-binding protein
MTTTWGETTIALIDAANNIAKMANGRIVINVDSGNKYKAPLGILDMVKGGEYDMWSYILILLER